MRLDKESTELAIQVFEAAFDYGSLCGASEVIQESIIKSLRPLSPIIDTRAKEMINKIKLMRQQ
ncbi:hypothetical protein [Paenibacillus pini]|uniref:Uncharacterized protein n=1 Tax=Paenibacillus pini JCM 16418 TaxID=1236976 RepID=W7YJ06_9BACL|nr:hypothetical protein [Paenibacillus pini]GAF10890.1 hypothetical protein JCM16418_5122 [Paenibacillus pini JCM 16418]